MTTWRPAALPGARPELGPAPSAELVPLYRRVSEDLLQAIGQRRMQPGDPLPPESELCRAYGVSRITIRKALDELAARHVIVRRRGSGTFIADAEHMAKSVVLTGFIDDVLMLNRMVVLASDRGPLPDHVARFAGLPETACCLRVVGLNHVTDGEPIVHIAFWFPPAIAARVSTADIAGPLPTIRLIERSHPVRLDHARQVVSAVAAPDGVAQALGIPRGAPVLRALRIYVDAAGEPMEIFEAHYHPDRYHFAATLYPKQG
ncbi:GntR family transcriptional regulator [Falsiroseomonas oryzae]|uniref:GntR family transcriptional regulator n=1 Tax=Falsiroseomonas oryzae TaxID=2766473 RepID=UPI0022EB0860|nr:GntR family transcriptional regulator [Roseomonas sp. MO-31]